MKRVSGPTGQRTSLHQHSWRLILVAGMFFVLLAALFTLQTPAPASAAAQRSLDCSTLTSSPSQGPVGAILAVNCTGANQPAGTQIQLGYTTDFVTCNAATDSQVSTVQKGGTFSGWLRWPTNTGTGTFAVCAAVAGSQSPKIADNTYQVLSTASPQVSVAPNIPEAGKQATVTGANFLPAGTNVNLIWQPTGGGQSVSLGTATSDNNGAFSQTFTVPARSSTGSYTLTALTGGTQPPTMSAATSFQVNGVTLVAVPTPSAQPDPTAATSPTVSASPTTTSGAITTGSPTNTNTKNSGTAGLLLPIGLVGLLLIIVALIAGILLVRRRRALALAAAAAAAPINTPFAKGQGSISQASTLPPPMNPGRGRAPRRVPGGNQAPIPFDPGLAEAMRQAQVSLFATPRPPVGEEVLS